MENGIPLLIQKIKEIQSLELVVYIHCTKANSLVQCLKQAAVNLSSSSKPINYESNDIKKKFDALYELIDYTKQIFVNCGRNVCLNYLLITPLHQVLEEFNYIRNQFLKWFTGLGFPEIGNFFKWSKKEMIFQNNTDIKRIFQFIVQIRKNYKLENRPDVLSRMTARLKSINNSNIQITTDEAIFISLPPLPNKLDIILTRSDLEFGPEIGIGQSGKVFKGVLISQQKQVAIKVFDFDQLQPQEFAIIKREVSILASLSHPNIIELIGYTDEFPYCIITELLSSSLKAKLQSTTSKLTPSERMIIAIDVAKGIEYLHERNIIHCDLKSLNVLLDNKNRAKICDFGLSKIQSIRSSKQEIIGTIPWMAPEIIQSSSSISIQADIYSYGILLWELLTCDDPYKDIPTEQLFDKIKNEKLRPTIPENLPTKLKNILQSCFDENPSKRPTIHQIIHFFSLPQCCFPNADLSYVLRITNLRRRHTPSVSDPSKMLEGFSFKNEIRNGPKVKQSYLETYAELENSVALNRAIDKIRRVIKAGNVPPEILIDTLKAISISKKNDLILRLVMLLSEILVMPKMIQLFVSQGGIENVIVRLLSSNDISNIDAAMVLLNSRFCPDFATIEVMRQLLSFSNSENYQIRIHAIELLIKMINIKFDDLIALPTFIIHFLSFSFKPLSSIVLKKLLKLVLHLVKSSESVPDSIVTQLVWLSSNCPESDLILSIAEAVYAKFPKLRNLFEYDIWLIAAQKLPLYQSLFENFPKLKIPDIARALLASSNDNDNALNQLIEFSKDANFAESMLTLLPFKIKRKYELLFKLYKVLIGHNFCMDPVSQQIEFYISCKEMLMTNLQSVVCSTVREVPVNANIIEKSGFQTRLVEVFLETSSNDSLWNLMSVIFTFCENNKKIHCFRLLCSKLSNLLNSNDERIRLSSFLCLSNIIDHSSYGVNYFWYVKSAIEFSSSPLSTVHQKSIEAVQSYSNHISSSKIGEIVDAFLENFQTKNTITSEIAHILIESDSQKLLSKTQIQHLNYISQ